MLNPRASRPPAEIEANRPGRRFNPLALILTLVLAIAGIAGVGSMALAASPHSACPADVAFMAYTDGTWITCNSGSGTPSPTGTTVSPSPSTPGPSVGPTISPSPLPSPTPSVSVSPSQQPGGGTACSVAGVGKPGGPDPWGGCWPGPGTAGLKAGTVLHSCSTTLTKSAVYDSCQFNGDLTITAQNVTITNSLIKGKIWDPPAGVKISDSTIDCGCLSTASETPPAVMASQLTLLRVEIKNAGHGVAPTNDVTIQDSWIHGLGANNDAHKDGIYVGDGTRVQITHNVVECNDGSAGGCTSAIGILNDFSNITHFTITKNLLNTNGSYCFYGGAKIQGKAYVASYIVFTDNVFGRAIYPQCGYYGPVTYFDVNTAGNVWARNAYTDGTPVAAEN